MKFGITTDSLVGLGQSFTRSLPDLHPSFLGAVVACPLLCRVLRAKVFVMPRESRHATSQLARAESYHAGVSEFSETAAPAYPISSPCPPGKPFVVWQSGGGGGGGGRGKNAGQGRWQKLQGEVSKLRTLSTDGSKKNSSWALRGRIPSRGSGAEAGTEAPFSRGRLRVSFWFHPGFMNLKDQ